MPVQSANQPQIITLDQWNGVNQSSSRPVIDDQELWWLENLFPIAPGHLRSAWGPGPPIYTAPAGTQILRIFFTTIDGQNPLGFMFLSDGTVDQVSINTGAVTHLGAVWQPSAPNYFADLKLWQPNQIGNQPGQSGGLLIGSPLGYFAWDGANLTSPGQTPPLWLTNNQTLDANGNPLVMPSGLPGIFALEVYKDRMWVMGQTVTSFSAPSNGADFSAVGGGGSFPYHGDQLTLSRTDMHASGGFLYLYNDSSVDGVADLSLIPGVLASGGAGQVTTLSTQFQLGNIDPQVGQRFFRPVGVWEQAATLYNGAGIYLQAGSQIIWVSQKVTNLLATLDPTPFFPTQCAAHIFGKKWMLFNAMLTDVWGIKRSMILAWGGIQDPKWVIASQKLNLTNIASFEQNSVITPYGTDGTSLYQLFARPSSDIQKRITTKLYSGTNLAVAIKNWKRVYFEFMDKFRGQQGVSFVGTLATHGGGLPNGVEDIAFGIDPSGYDIVPAPVQGAGINAGVDMWSYSPDFTVARLSLTFDVRTLFGA